MNQHQLPVKEPDAEKPKCKTRISCWMRVKERFVRFVKSDIIWGFIWQFLFESENGVENTDEKSVQTHRVTT